MITILLVVVTLIILAALLLALKRGAITFEDPARFPFRANRPLTDREQVLYWRLRRALPDLVVLSQVSLSRFLQVESGHNQLAWLNRINRMTIDFLVCLPDSTIVAAIELDDASHESGDRIAADLKKAKAIESAGLTLLRYREIPSEEELRKAIGA